MMNAAFKGGNNIHLKPTIHTYAILISAWYRSGHNDTPRQTMNLLKKVIHLYSIGELKEGPNDVTYNSIIDSHVKKGDMKGAHKVFSIMKKDFNSGNKHAKPNLITYTTLNQGHTSMRFLKEIIHLHSIGDLKEGPDTSIFNSVMHTYAIHGDTNGANYVLQLMKNGYKPGTIGNIRVKPNKQTYTILINAYSKSGNKDAPQQAMHLLKKMIQLHSKGEIEEEPCAIMYNSTMNTFAARGDTQGVNVVFDMMEENFNSSGNSDVRPNFRTYNILLKAYANLSPTSINNNSDTKNNTINEIEKILQQMNDLYNSGDLDEKPNNVTYKSMIWCLRNYEGTEVRIQELKNLIE